MNNLEEKDFDTIINKIDALKPIATEVGCSLSQLAIAWCLLNKNVSTVITGASKPEQVVENFKSIEIVKKLTPAIQEKIEAVLKNDPNSKQKSSDE